MRLVVNPAPGGQEVDEATAKNVPAFELQPIEQSCIDFRDRPVRPRRQIPARSELVQVLCGVLQQRIDVTHEASTKANTAAAVTSGSLTCGQ